MNTALLEELTKLRAFSSHLLGGFLRLRGRYAMLHPMLFYESVIHHRGNRSRAPGFAILKDTLFLTCSQDIANLVSDENQTSVSIANVIKKLQFERVTTALEHATADAVGSTSTDQDIVAFWTTERQDRRERFRRDLAELISLSTALTASETLAALKTIRRKAAAHLDIGLRDGEYVPLDIASLGMKWKDLEQVITRVRHQSAISCALPASALMKSTS